MLQVMYKAVLAIITVGMSIQDFLEFMNGQHKIHSFSLRAALINSVYMPYFIEVS